jgi:hypothetical protein
MLSMNEYEWVVNQRGEAAARYYVLSSGVPSSSVVNKTIELLDSGGAHINPIGELELIFEQELACNSARDESY